MKSGTCDGSQNLISFNWWSTLSNRFRDQVDRTSGNTWCCDKCTMLSANHVQVAFSNFGAFFSHFQFTLDTAGTCESLSREALLKCQKTKKSNEKKFTFVVLSFSPVLTIDAWTVQVCCWLCPIALATTKRFFDLLHIGWQFPWRCVPSFSRSWWFQRGFSFQSPIPIPCHERVIPTWRWHVWLQQRRWLQLLQDELKDSIKKERKNV